MLYNEINLIKLLDKNILSSYHLYRIDFDAQRAICFEIVVDKKFDFKINEDLYFNENSLNFSLLYKNSPFDGSGVRNYVFGDFCVYLEKPFEKQMKSEHTDIDRLPDFIVKFNKSFNSNKEKIFNFLKTASEKIENNKITQIFVHFNFFECLNVNNWHEIENIIPILDNWFIETRKNDLFVYNKKTNNYSLLKSFLPSVSSGDKKNDMQFANFDEQNRFKAFSLNHEDLWVVFYHNKLMQALTVATINVPKGTTYNFQLIPSGNIDKESLVNFINKIADITNKNTSSLKHEQAVDELSDDIFNSVENSVLTLDRLALFDIVLVQKGERTNIVLSEISNISRDFLVKNITRQKIAISIFPKILQNELGLKKEFEFKYTPAFYKSFFYIHEKNKQNYKKFLIWLFKFFMGQKNHDEELTSVFIDKIFSEMRTNKNIDYLKFFISYKFIQQFNEGECMNEESKKLGEYCGNIAYPVSYVIGNFEASKICQLKQQITTINDVVEFLNDSLAALTLHRKDKNNVAGSSPEQVSIAYDKAIELIGIIKDKEFDQTSFIAGCFSTYFRGRRFVYNKQKETEKEISNEQE